jgi:hypothetical protein
MTLQSLITEITGALPEMDMPARIVPGKRLVVIFEDTLGALRSWQNELLKIDSDRLRSIDVSVACIPNDGEQPLLNGRPTVLPVADLKRELQGTDTGRFEVILLNRDGNVMLRSGGPVTIEQLEKAVATIGETKAANPGI